MSLQPFPKIEIPRQMTFVRILEEFEGPILSEYKASHGSGLYLEKWCARDGDTNRYLIVRTDQRAIAEYLAVRITMLSLLTEGSDGGGFIIDRLNGNLVTSYAIRLSDLPTSYMPKAQALHDENLRPNWEKIPQHFLINTDWDAKLLASIERLYLNLAGFAFLTEPGKNRRVPSIALSYEYDGGYSIMHLFNKIRTSIPLAQRARSVGVSATSPGVLTIDAPSEIVQQLTRSFDALPRSSMAYDSLHEWSKLSPKRIDGLPQTAYHDLEALCTSLEIDILSLFPEPSLDNPNPRDRKEAILVAGKLAAAYYRRLWQILKPEPRVEFISVKSPTTTSSGLPPNAFEEGDDDGDLL